MAEQGRLRATVTGSSRVTGWYLLWTKHPEMPLARTHSAKERGRQISVEEKVPPPGIFAVNLGQEFESLRARQSTIFVRLCCQLACKGRISEDNCRWTVLPRAHLRVSSFVPGQLSR